MIEQTRHILTPADGLPGRPVGLMRAAEPFTGHATYCRRAPPAELGAFVEHFWSVNWQLPDGASHLQESLPHPNVQLVWETTSTQRAPEGGGGSAAGEVAGVHTGRFVKTLRTCGRAVGVKFRAGAFHACSGKPVAELRNKVIPAQAIFGEAMAPVSRLFASGVEAERLFDLLADSLMTFQGAPDAEAAMACHLVELCRNNSSILTSRHLAARGDLSVRALQRMFHKHVGATPKWVVRRYRLQELIERVNSAEAIHWAGFACDLGYADQAHLIRDFRSATGLTPEAYQRRSQGAVRR